MGRCHSVSSGMEAGPFFFCVGYRGLRKVDRSVSVRFLP